MKPVNNKLELRIDEVDAGVLKTDAIEEHGTIIAMAKDADVAYDAHKAYSRFKVGDVLYFKAWALDIIKDKKGVKHYFIDADSEAICAVETM